MNTSLETTPSDPGGLPSGGGQSHWGPKQWELQMRLMGAALGCLQGKGAIRSVFLNGASGCSRGEAGRSDGTQGEELLDSRAIHTMKSI